MKISLVKSNLMKSAFFAFCVLGASAAFGQVASVRVNPVPIVYSFDSHPETARRTPLAGSQNLNGGEVYVYAEGERPLWEVATPVYEVPLGDSARRLREEHALAPKAAHCWQNQ